MEEHSYPSPLEKRLTDEEVFSQIWLNPRKVFKFIYFYQYDKYMAILLVLAGIANAFQKISSINISIVSIIIIYVIMGAIVGLIGNYIFAALISWTGDWIKGRASTKAILKVLAYSSIPLVFTPITVIARVVLRGNGDFNDDLDGYNSLTQFIDKGLLLLSGVLATWAFVICVVGIAEVQKFSIGKAILNLILPFLLIIIPIIVIALLVKMGN
ncbi:Yip1 family protein [Pedobacter frigiditerrae]|uniref:Yip1 family protein n=1 Tax=Pedobacter frigiditerrae TaxID=2530452 RepID=UPI00292D2775|nr:Yip1 family protein [Pedobacter frigiditerrae]